MSLRHRHGYAADLPRGLPGSSCTTAPGVPRPHVRDGCAPLPAQIRQVRAGACIKGRNTPVPRVLLSVSLAGPAPSGSTGPSRLCQGCSHPPRHHPDQAAPSSTALLRQGSAAKVSHLHSSNSASRRTYPSSQMRQGLDFGFRGGFVVVAVRCGHALCDSVIAALAVMTLGCFPGQGRRGSGWHADPGVVTLTSRRSSNLAAGPGVITLFARQDRRLEAVAGWRTGQ